MVEAGVSSDLPEGLNEAFRMKTHNRSVRIIVQVQTVAVIEQISAPIRLYADYLHAVLGSCEAPPSLALLDLSQLLPQ